MSADFFRNSLLIGFGALGKALYSMLSSRGIFLSYVVYPSASNQSDGMTRFTRALPSPDTFSPQFIIICVPDGKITDVATLLASHYPQLDSVRVIHTAGSMDASVLNALKNKGALTGVWHPMMTFVPEKRYHSLNGAIVSVEAESPLSEELLELTRILGGHPIILPPEYKPLYHLLGVFSSNFLFALLEGVNEILNDIKKVSGNTELKIIHMMPIMLQTIENYLGNPSTASLSGPVKRRDFDTIARHVESIQKFHPDLLSLYKTFSFYLAKRCHYSSQEFAKLLSILGDNDGSEK